jgi:hypothetical protein
VEDALVKFVRGENQKSALAAIALSGDIGGGGWVCTSDDVCVK